MKLISFCSAQTSVLPVFLGFPAEEHHGDIKLLRVEASPGWGGASIETPPPIVSRVPPALVTCWWLMGPALGLYVKMQNITLCHGGSILPP